MTRFSGCRPVIELPPDGQSQVAAQLQFLQSSPPTGTFKRAARRHSELKS